MQMLGNGVSEIKAQNKKVDIAIENSTKIVRSIKVLMCIDCLYC